MLEVGNTMALTLMFGTAAYAINKANKWDVEDKKRLAKIQDEEKEDSLR